MPEDAHEAFCGVAWRHVDSFYLGLGQGLAVHLSVRGHWDRIEHDEYGRHHIVGQQLAEVRTQRNRRGPWVGCCDDVSNNARLALVVSANGDSCVPHTLNRPQSHFHICQFNAVAADLDLTVLAS